MLNIEKHSDAQAQASQALLSSHLSLASPINLLDYFPSTSHLIVEVRESEHAVVLFTKEVNTCEQRVMKLLRNYKDTRYDLDTLEKRQQCQLEALWRNRAFSPEIYVGLAPVRKREQSSICIGEILTSPKSHELEPETEYVLVMEELPEESSLASLMSKLDALMLRKYLMLLTNYIANIHNQLLRTTSEKGYEQWGTYKQLEEKLHENLALLDLVPGKSKNKLHCWYMRNTTVWLQEKLLTLFGQQNYRDAFDQRVQEQKIKLCHGDLKVPHIWALSNKAQHAQMEPAKCIRVVDAIDFNPVFCNVDILSDFAMLVNDIQTRTGSASLADEMVDYYLELTEQEGDVARLILGFYLVEKAIVGAAISIVYDNLPQLGRKHLKVARMRLKKLLKMQGAVSFHSHLLNDNQHSRVVRAKPAIKVGIQDILFACIPLGYRRKLP